VRRPRLQYSTQVVRNTAADSYRAMKRMACNNFRKKKKKEEEEEEEEEVKSNNNNNNNNNNKV